MTAAAEFLAARRDLALVGLRGSGKTTIGRALAARLGRALVDTDSEIAAAAGQPIAELFRTRGEPAFRALEREVVCAALRGDGRVLSLGGGAILDADTRRLLREKTVCIWLVAPPDELRRRLDADPVSASQRPALTGGDVLDEIETVLAQREALYREAADYALKTGDRPAAAALSELITWLDGSVGTLSDP